MIKKLSNNLSLHSNANFPKKFKSSHKKYKVLIGLGANINEPLKTFSKLIYYIQKDPHLDLTKTSPILKNPPFGYENQPFFYNACLLVQTNLEPIYLLRHLQHIEKIFGRKRSFRNAPRSLDLDIIFFQNKRYYNDRLVLPHKDWHNRLSVLIPMLLIG